MTTLRYKVYDHQGEHIASCKHPVEAAVLVGVQPDGATVRAEHNLVVWIEGSEGWGAGDSYDQTADIILQREHLGKMHRQVLIETGRHPNSSSSSLLVREHVLTDAGLA
jgi:hypothetical protein